MVMQHSNEELSSPVLIQRPPQTSQGRTSPSYLPSSQFPTNQKKSTLPITKMQRHQGLKPMENTYGDGMISTHTANFPKTARNNRNLFSVSSQRQQTPIEHKILEDKIMRKKKRSLRDAMKLQNNITALMGKVQETLQAERRTWISPLSQNSTQ